MDGGAIPLTEGLVARIWRALVALLVVLALSVPALPGPRASAAPEAGLFALGHAFKALPPQSTALRAEPGMETPRTLPPALVQPLPAAGERAARCLLPPPAPRAGTIRLHPVCPESRGPPVPA